MASLRMERWFPSLASGVVACLVAALRPHLAAASFAALAAAALAAGASCAAGQVTTALLFMSPNAPAPLRCVLESRYNDDLCRYVREGVWSSLLLSASGLTMLLFPARLLGSALLIGTFLWMLLSVLRTARTVVDLNRFAPRLPRN